LDFSTSAFWKRLVFQYMFSFQIADSIFFTL
jgi:hypothetical protein